MEKKRVSGVSPKPAQGRATSQDHKVFVRSSPPLPAQVTNKQLQDHFRGYRTKRAEIYLKGIHGVVVFKSQSEAQRSVSQMNGTLLLSRFKLKLELEKPKTATVQMLNVERLHPSVTEEELRKLITVSVESVSLNSEAKTATIYLSSQEDSKIIEAMNCLEGKVFHGVKSRVCLYQEPLRVPPQSKSKQPLKQEDPTTAHAVSTKITPSKPPLKQEDPTAAHAVSTKITPSKPPLKQEDPTAAHAVSTKITPSKPLHAAKDKASFIVVKNLTPNVSKNDLMTFLSTKTYPTTCDIDPHTRYAYVQFSSSENAAVAVTNFNRTSLKRCVLSVSLAEPPTHIRGRQRIKTRRSQKPPKEHSDCPAHQELVGDTPIASEATVRVQQGEPSSKEKGKKEPTSKKECITPPHYNPLKPAGLDSKVLSALGDHVQPSEDRSTLPSLQPPLNGTIAQASIVQETLSHEAESGSDATLPETESEPMLSQHSPESENFQETLARSALLHEIAQPDEAVNRQPDSEIESPNSQLSPLQEEPLLAPARNKEANEGTVKLQKPLVNTDKQATSVYITAYSYCSSSERFQSYLKQHIIGNKFKFNLVSFEKVNKNEARIEVVFDSTNNAKRALKRIAEKDSPDIEASLMKAGAVTSAELSKKIDGFKESIAKKQEMFLSRYKRVDDLKEKYHSPKLERTQSERQVLLSEIMECELQQEQFKTYCSSCVLRLDQLLAGLPTSRKLPFETLSQMRKDFGRECNRFNKGLPIYAYRSLIIDTVKSNQVCILIGATGSGKSTQLVQYLYDAGFGENGVIVCTQPRKVAAITLAKYVSTEEMCVPFGEVLGYKTGLKSNSSEQTKILYVTDHTLLNECIKDPLFSKYSCLVIDEAHERSIHTDILLAFVKKCLPQRQDLKVIVTSATIDPSVFKQYFQVKECPVIEVPGRLYPVEVKWNALGVSTCPMKRDYVLDAVDLATDIHKTEPPGDILVFLTSAVEIERACQRTTEQLQNEVVVLPLHGKLQSEEQQKVFEIHQQRKIVFATNVAETSVTIPGVKYIVDSGLAKEMKFDAKKNMNSLEVSMISKSSAEQRKGRAGRTSAGKCYRMYSEELYSTMQDMMVPEMLRVTLSHTVLKLYEFGITDVLSFDFVESPDQTALITAVESLEFLGAVKNDTLTEVGKKMCALPIDPHFSKVLLDGIEQGVGLEAATAVAISTLGGSVFFRGGTDEMKMESDRKKVSFCHPAGDQMTYLTAYFQWKSQEKNEQKKWCMDNSINSKGMRIVRDTRKELCDIAKHQLHVDLHNDIASLADAELKLPKLFFDAFIRNIAIYLGHERIGYLNERLPQEQLIIFPGSPLCQLNLVPDVVVYEKTLKTSQNFLLQVLPVEEAWIQEAISDGRLPCHPRESLMYQHCKVSPIVIDSLGTHTLSLLHKSQQQFKESFTQLYPTMKFEFQFQQEEGKVTIFSQDFHEEVKGHIQQRISTIRERYKQDDREYGAANNDDNILIVLGNGGVVQSVIMPDQYNIIRVKGPRGEGWQENILEQLKTQGAMTVIDQRDVQIRVKFKNPDDAVAVVESVQPPPRVVVEPEFRGSGKALSQFTLEIEWTRRERKGFAFVKLTCEEDLPLAVTQLQSYNQRKRDLLFKLSNCGEKIFVAKVGNHTEQEILDVVKMWVEGIDYDGIQVELGYEKSFETTSTDLAELTKALGGLISEFATSKQYSLQVHQPKQFHRTWKAVAKFQNAEEGLKCLRQLPCIFLKGKGLRVKPKLFSSFCYSPLVYEALKEPLHDICEEIQKLFASVKISEVTLENRNKKEGAVLVKVQSDNVDDFIIAKHALNTVVLPDVIECRNPMLREYVRTANCQRELRRIQNDTSTFICRNLREMNIKIYGSEPQRTSAKIDLNNCLELLSESTNCIDIELKGPGKPPGLMKHFVSKFGHDLKQLVDDEKGITVARIDPRKHILTMFATEEGRQFVLQIIRDFTASINPYLQPQDSHQDVVVCCACLTDIEGPKFIFRLEYCGHAYCIDCVQMQVAPLTVEFPIVCAAEGCSKTFVWKDFENLFQRTSFKPRLLANASLKSYIGVNPKLVRNCPTPDCSSIYRVSENGKCYFCSECQATICTTCHDPYHDGVTCEMYQRGKEEADRFERWMRRNPRERKRCPKCRTPIEKTEGCNSVCCGRCRAHICWVCPQLCFENEQSCYAHLMSVHGSFV